MIWAGDFNCHSPVWDDDNYARLFTTIQGRRSEELLCLLADYETEIALPKGIPTMMHMVTKLESRTDNVWLSNGLVPLLLQCSTDNTRKFTHTDHYSIITVIDLPQERVAESSHQISKWQNDQRYVTT